MRARWEQDGSRKRFLSHRRAHSYDFLGNVNIFHAESKQGRAFGPLAVDYPNILRPRSTSSWLREAAQPRGHAIRRWNGLWATLSAANAAGAIGGLSSSATTDSFYKSKSLAIDLTVSCRRSRASST